MKKITFKIKAGTKKLILGLSFLAAIGLTATHGGVHAVTKALVPFSIVSTLKKKGVTLTEEEEAEYKNLDAAFAEFGKGFGTVEEIAALKESVEAAKLAMSPESLKKLIDAGTEEMNESLKAQALIIDQLKTMGVGGTPGGKTLRDQIKEKLSTDESKAILKSMKNKTNAAANFSFEVKAAADMTVSTSTAYTTAATAIAFPQPEFIPGLNNIARNQPFILQLLNVMPTQKANIVYTEKYNAQGAAGWVGEKVAAPEVSFDIRIGESRAKMVDAYIKVSVQMLDDVDYMAAEIEKELIYQIAIKIDTDLLQGDGIGDNLEGIKTFVGGYILTTLTTTIPNNCDAILAAATQIATDNFRPDIAILNPIDYNQTKLLKGTTGYYIVNPNNQNDKWGGIIVVPSNQVPVGYTMVMDSSKTNVFRYMDFTLSYGWINDDFTKNMVTILASQRLHSFIKSNDTNGFVYDSLAVIKGAITAA